MNIAKFILRKYQLTTLSDRSYDDLYICVFVYWRHCFGTQCVWLTYTEQWRRWWVLSLTAAATPEQRWCQRMLLYQQSSNLSINIDHYDVYIHSKNCIIIVAYLNWQKETINEGISVLRFTCC